MLDLEANELKLEYPLPGGSRQTILDLEVLQAAAGSAVGITGPSGSGKTSLVYVLCGLEVPRAGSVRWGGRDITLLSEPERDRWRRESVGLVFQDFHLFAGLTALQNVLLPVTFARARVPREADARARALLTRVGLDEGWKRVEKLSRGELQRVAVVRAVLFSPPIVLADEPTASLDAAAGAEVGRLLRTLCREAGSTLLVVSHDPSLLATLDRVVTLRNGRLAPAAEGSPC